ncbi:MAG: type II secretion system protein GspJ [Gammaproteobacteria bacterium]|nr:type II secretion system protein GspJ [Gammaproteobacteria bacterium]
MLGHTRWSSRVPGGTIRPVRHRSNLQRVAYRVDEDGRLVRYFWRVLDRAEDSVPIDQVLLEEVQDFRVRLLDAEGEASDTWPGEGTSPLPAAVEVILVD